MTKEDDIVRFDSRRYNYNIGEGSLPAKGGDEKSSGRGWGESRGRRHFLNAKSHPRPLQNRSVCIDSY